MLIAHERRPHGVVSLGPSTFSPAPSASRPTNAESLSSVGPLADEPYVTGAAVKHNCFRLAHEGAE